MWWVQRPGECVYLPFGAAHQVFSIDENWTALLTWMINSDNESASARNKVKMVNRLKGVGRPTGVHKRRKRGERRKTTFGRYKKGGDRK